MRGHDYEIGDAPFDGALVWDDAWEGRRPCVMIFHGWEGRSDAQVEVREALARAGYAAFACDLFGKGMRGDLAADNSALIAPFLQDRAMLRVRLLENAAVVRALPQVRPDRFAAIGFCFGGLCVLDLARAGPTAERAARRAWAGPSRSSDRPWPSEVVGGRRRISVRGGVIPIGRRLLGAMIEPCASVEQPGWLRLREALWPHGSKTKHLAEMAAFLAQPERFAQFVAYTTAHEPFGFVEASLRVDHVNGTSSSPVAFLEGLYVVPRHRRKGIARSLGSSQLSTASRTSTVHVPTYGDTTKPSRAATEMPARVITAKSRVALPPRVLITAAASSFRSCRPSLAGVSELTRCGLIDRTSPTAEHDHDAAPADGWLEE